MHKEQFERNMAFIVAQQAKFSANLEKLQERDAQWEARNSEWQERMARVDRQIEQLVGSVSILRDAVISLTRHVERHDQKIIEIDRGLQELVERGKETDTRLNALL